MKEFLLYNFILENSSLEKISNKKKKYNIGGVHANIFNMILDNYFNFKNGQDIVLSLENSTNIQEQIDDISQLNPRMIIFKEEKNEKEISHITVPQDYQMYIYRIGREKNKTYEIYFMLNKQLKIKKNKLDYVTCNSYIVNRVLEDLAIDNYENLYNYFKLERIMKLFNDEYLIFEQKHFNSDIAKLLIEKQKFAKEEMNANERFMYIFLKILQEEHSDICAYFYSQTQYDMFQRNYINNVKNIESFLLDVNNNDKCMFIVNKKKTYVYLENIQAKKEKDTTKKETTKKDTTKKDTTNKDKTYYLIDKHLLEWNKLLLIQEQNDDELIEKNIIEENIMKFFLSSP